MTRFVIATGGMVALLALALVFGGGWGWAALFYMTVATFFLDKLVALAAPDQPGAEFPSGDGLSVFLGLAQFPLLYGGVYVLASDVLLAEKVALFVALSLYLGQIGNSNAHELIHRPQRWAHRLGVAVYATVLFGHHASAHVRVHHVHAATDRDPSSARLGEGFWRYLWRAWSGSLIEGYRAETRLRKGRGVHPYRWYGLGALASLGAAFAVGGGAGVLWLGGLAAYAQIQLFLSDYVQHYGLRRVAGEAIGPQHSWNAPQGFSSALMVNAPRHSDHHCAPGRGYPGLRLGPEMPVLPQSLPVMAVIALLPPVWRGVMDHRARKWAEGRAG